MGNDAETVIRTALMRLHREYQEKAQPLIDALARIESMRPAPPVFIHESVISDEARQRILEILEKNSR